MNIVNWTKDGISEISNNTDIIIKIDDCLLSTHSINLPPSRGINTKKALSFALEDKLLNDIEQLEFFSKKINSIHNVIVIQKELLNDIKKEIKDKKLNVKGVFPNFMFIPLAENGVHYTENEDYISYRDGLVSGGNMHKELFYEVFTKQETILTTEFSTDYALINLIQVDLNDFIKKYIVPWKSIFILAILSLSIYIYFIHTSNTLFEKELVSLQQQNTTLFQKIFPDVTKIVDIRLQTESRMNNFGEQETLRKGDLLKALETGPLPQNINSIEYDEILQIK